MLMNILVIILVTTTKNNENSNTTPIFINIGFNVSKLIVSNVFTASLVCIYQYEGKI